MVTSPNIPFGWTICRAATGEISVTPPTSVGPALTIQGSVPGGDVQRVLEALCEALITPVSAELDGLASVGRPALVTRWGVRIEVEDRTVLALSPNHIARDSTFGPEVERNVVEMAVRRLMHILAPSSPPSMDGETNFGSTLADSGFRAYCHGRPISACPFENESPAAVLWESGWLDALMHSMGHEGTVQGADSPSPSPPITCLNPMPPMAQAVRRSQ